MRQLLQEHSKKALPSCAVHLARSLAGPPDGIGAWGRADAASGGSSGGGACEEGGGELRGRGGRGGGVFERLPPGSCQHWVAALGLLLESCAQLGAQVVERGGGGIRQ